MVLETDSQLLATGQSEVEKKSPHYIFFAGSSMEQHSVQPVEKMLTELAGGEKENVTAFTSVLSSEVTKKQRIKEMAQAIEDAFTGKQETTIILYSLGAMEFATALLEMLKTREQKRQKNGEPFQPFELSHIKLVLRSPAGLVRNISDSWRQAREFVGLALSTVTGPHTILETTLNFPPKTSEGALFLEKAYQALLEVFPQVERRSLFRKKVTGRSFAQGILQQQIPGSDHLQDKRFGTIQAEVQKIDSKIWKILQNNLQPYSEEIKDELKYHFTQRQKLFERKNALAQLLANKDSLLTGPDWQKKTIETSAVALLGLGRVLARSFFGYGNVEIFRWLKSRGIRISVLAPDAEVFSGIETLAEFFDLDDSGGSHRAKVDQVLSEPGTHISMSGNTSALAEALRVVQAL